MVNKSKKRIYYAILGPDALIKDMAHKSTQKLLNSKKFKQPIWISDPNRCGSGSRKGYKCVKSRKPKCRGCPTKCTKWVSKPKLCGKSPINRLKSIRKSTIKQSRKSPRKSHRKQSRKSPRKSRRKSPKKSLTNQQKTSGCGCRGVRCLSRLPCSRGWKYDKQNPDGISLPRRRKRNKRSKR